MTSLVYTRTQAQQTKTTHVCTRLLQKVKGECVQVEGMSVVTRLFCSRIQPCLVACVKQRCSPFSTGTGTFGLASFSRWSGQNLYRSFHTRMGINPSSFSLQISVPRSPVAHVPIRGVVNFSKRRGKKKTVKAVSKRFHRTGSGKLKYWQAGKVHNMLSKSRNHRRSLRKPKYASKVQLKTLNKMISGW